MLKEQRFNIILSELNRNNVVTMEELIQATNSSRSTVRRDIEELEEKHFLMRVRGGIKKVTSLTPSSAYPSDHETPFLARLNMEYDEKRRIAQAARNLVNPNETLFLGAGTTIYEFAKTLHDVSPLYVATNDLKNAIALAEFPNIDLTVLGGTLRKSHYSLNGYFTEQMVSQMHADKTFIGVDAVDSHMGYMNFSTAEAQTNKLYIQASHQVIILCDHTKFEAVAFVNICALKDAALVITGKELDKSHVEQMRRLGVNLMTV